MAMMNSAEIETTAEQDTGVVSLAGLYCMPNGKGSARGTRTEGYTLL